MLLVTLVLIAVAAMALAGVSRASLGNALEAKQARNRLQRRWGVLTLESGLLSLVEQKLNQVEEEHLTFAQSVRGSLMLTDQRFDVVMADEQAKLNVAALNGRVDRQRSERIIKKLLREQGCDERVRIRPVQVNRVDSLAEIGSFSQVFPVATGQGLFEPRRQGLAVVDLVTCWGNGKINYHRASEAVIRATLSGIASQLEIDKLISTRNDIPDIELSELIRLMDLTDEQREKIEPMLTAESTSLSLSVVVRDGQTVDHYMMVGQTSSASGGDVGSEDLNSEDGQDTLRPASTRVSVKMEW